MNQSYEESEPWKHGIKLQFLVDWSRQQGFTPTITTREVCENFIKPATQATQLSLCKQLLLSEDTEEFVGFPSAFISHAWDDHFPEVLEALTSYFTAEPDVVIWFDIFCNNQHQTASFHFGWWCDGFKKAIHSFGRTVMVLAPWNDPIPLQRGWCIWELYCTIEGKRSDGKCKFDVAMSPASVEQFIADVDADPESALYKMLAKIDTSKSKCSKAEDKERIHDAIRRTVGFNELNKEIFEVMRGWVTSKYEERYKTLEAQGDHAALSTMNNLAILYDNQGNYEKALSLYQECLRQNAETFGQQHPNTLRSMSNLACLYDDQGQLTKASRLHKECFRTRKDILGDSHPDTLHSMNNLACLFLSKGKLVKALPLHEECLTMRKVVLGENHPDTLSSMNNLSRLYYEQGEYEKALPLCKECLRLRKTILGENHADTLTSMNNLGFLYMGQGEYEKALPLYEECLRQSIVEFGENHPGTLAFMKNLENCQKLSRPSTVTSYYVFTIICNVYKKQSNLKDYLHELHADLQRLDQDLEKTPPGFKDTVQHLVSSKLLDNSDKKVRLLVGCCLVDIFRIYAPDTPYKDGVMLRAFEVMSILIRNLETAINGSEEQSQSIYIIQSLATVKSCVIPVIMAQRGVRGALETAQTLFQALIDSVRPDHSDARIPEEWIDVLLFPLLPQSKADNPTAYKLVAGTLRSVGPLPVVQSCFGQLASDVLVNPSGGRNTEVTEEIYSLIYELHLVHPPLLFNIIPTITVLLKVDNDEVRAKIVKLLGKLYTSDHYDYTREFDKEFREFASRINDRIPQVRNEMVETIVMLIRSRPRLKSFLEELILKKLRDPEEEIRLHTLKKLLDFAQTNITSLSTETYNEICDRVKDKKSEVRKVALIGLSKLYCHHVSSRLHPISRINGRDNSDITEGILDEVFHRLEFVPSIVLKSWGYPDYPTKHLILHLLQEYILPKSIKLNSGNNGDDSVVENEADGDDNRKNSLDEVRASALVLLFRSMREEVDKVSFGAILNFKMKIADELHHFLRLKSAKSGNENVGNGGERLSLNSTPVDDSARFAEIRQSLYNITFSLPLLPDKKHTVFDRLITSKDKFILKLVESCVDASDNITEGLQHKQDLQKRLDSKSPLGEYMGVVYDFAAHFLFDVHVIGALLRALNSYESKVDSTEIADILTFLSKFSAKSFSRSSSYFADWAKQSIVEKTDKGRQKQMKEKLFNGFVATTIAASRWLINDESRVELVEYLVEAAQNASDPYICLKLGEVLGNLAFIYYGDDKNRASGSVIKLLQTICSKKALNVGNQRILNNLCILSSVFRVPSIAYEKAETVGITARAIHEASVSLKTNIFKFLFDDLFKIEDASAEAKSVGLRIAANLLCCEDDYNRIEGVGEKPLSPFSSPSSSSFSSLNYLVSLSDLIFECISNHGQVFSGVGVSEEEDQQQLLEASAIDALILSRIHDFASLITVEQWLELAWTLAKSDREIKKHLLQYLTSTIQIHPVHLRFLAFPCLFATDSEFAEAAQKSLIFAIKRLRRTNEEISAKLVAEKDEVQRERLKHFVQYTTPETVLPYVLYLLSYHPDFPSSMRVDNDEDKRKLKDMMKCVQMLIHSLQVTLRQETSNLPFLFKQLNTIMQNYLDREDNENAGVHFITRLTLKILTEQVKTVDNMQVYPNEVIPPEELFVATEVGKPQKLLSLVAMDQGRGGAVDTELVIEKAINSTHRSKNTLTSPVRSGGASFIKTKASPDYKEMKISAKQSKKEGTKKKAPTKALVEEAPTRSLPKRGAKAVTSYAEAEEDESEVERWNENAAKVARRSLSHERNSFSKIPQRLSSSSNQSRPSTASWKSEVDNEDDDELFGDDLVKSALKPSRLSQSSHRTSSSSDKPPSSLLKRKLSNGKLNLSHDSVSSEHLFERPEETDENSTDDLFEDKPTKRKKTETSSKVKSPAITKSNGKRKFDEGEVEENVVDDRDDGKTKPQRKRAKSNADNLALNKSRSNGKVGKGEKKIIEDSEEEEELNDSVLFSQQKNKGSSKRKGRTSTK